MRKRVGNNNNKFDKTTKNKVNVRIPNQQVD